MVSGQPEEAALRSDTLRASHVHAVNERNRSRDERRATPVVAGATPVPDNGETALLCRAAFVPVMKAAQVRNGHDVSIGWRRDRSRDRRIFVEREVRP